MLRHYLLAALLWCTCVYADAQEQKVVNIQLDARGSYKREYVDGHAVNQNSGFKGDLIDVVINGNLSSRFGYMYRQRLNGINKDRTFFEATDFLYLRYQATRHMAILGGKWALMLGGWEFDAKPIDVFQLNEYAYHIPCYEWGVNMILNTDNGKDQWVAQVCESPFRKIYEDAKGQSADMYAYNLIWYGHHGRLHTIWSTNLIEYAPGHYSHFISLGNKVNIADKVDCYVDIQNRASTGQRFLLSDCSIYGKVMYRPTEKLDVYARVGYDVNQSGTDKDQTLSDGTEITTVGGGVNYYPLKDKTLRFHATYNYSFGKNTTPEAFLQNKQSLIDVGMSWAMKVL